MYNGNADDRVFELMLRKMDDIHEDIKSFNTKLEDHVKDDLKVYRDVWLIKRAFQAMWGAIGIGGTFWLGWKGLKG